jgi:predicted nucleic acid-binding protein
MISLVNEFSAILDTCVLLPISLCDLLLQLAEDPALYSPRWSPEILQELERNLTAPKFNLTVEKARYRIASMQSAFPEALVTGHGSLVDSMPNNSKDRPVLAAAVYAKVDAVVTVDKRGFPESDLRAFGIERLTPDEFLVHQWYLDPDLVRCRLLRQASTCRKDLSKHLSLLERMVPTFVRLVRQSEFYAGEIVSEG